MGTLQVFGLLAAAIFEHACLEVFKINFLSHMWVDWNPDNKVDHFYDQGQLFIQK